MKELGSQNDKMNAWLVRFTFLGIFIYIILRAFSVEPMLDELATFYNYIQSGHITDDRALVDANNHLLVSYVGWKLYALFGDHFILFRLLSLVTFPIYFFSLKFLIERFVANRFTWLVLLAATTTPWIVEYFGFARGYGAGLAFLFLGICLVVLFKEKKNGFYFFGLMISFALCISSNLSLLIPSLLVIGYALLIHVIYWKTIKNKWVSIVTLVLFAKFFKFILTHIDKLKAANALWWGSLDGFWEVTGKSLSRNIFFSDVISLKYLFVGALLIFILSWILAQRKMKFMEIFFAEKFWLPGIFIACITSIIVMAVFFHVNYPMDRVAMYLVPLFMLSIGMLLSKQKYARWLLLGLIWFPISFCTKVNLQTSIFSPEDRITAQFLARIQKNVRKNDALSVDYVSHLSYAYATRNQKDKIHIAIESLTDPTIEQGEYHISWITKYPWNNFKMIYQDKHSKNRLYQRKVPFDKKLVFDTIISSIKSKQTFIPVVQLQMTDAFYGKRIQSCIEAEVRLTEKTLGLNVVNQIDNKKNETRFSQRTRFDWYFGHALNYQFIFPNYPMKIDETDSVFKILFQNEENRYVEIHNIHVQFFLVSK